MNIFENILKQFEKNANFEFSPDLENLINIHQFIENELLNNVSDIRMKKMIFQWLRILLNNPFDLQSFNTDRFRTFIIQDNVCAAYFVSNLMKSTQKSFYSKNMIFNQKVPSQFFYEFLLVLSKRVKLDEFNSEQENNSGKNQQELIKLFLEESVSNSIKSLKYKIVTEQGMNSFIDKSECLSVLFADLNLTNSMAFDLAFSISRFSFDVQTILRYFNEDMFCREGLWINSLLILSFLIYEEKVKFYDCINELQKIIYKTVFFECINIYSLKIRESALFFIYCVTQRIISEDKFLDQRSEMIDYIERITLSVAFFDNSLECRRAATTILIDLQGNNIISVHECIDFISVKRKKNFLNVHEKYFEILKPRILQKIFDDDLEMQIICLEWIKKHKKTINLKDCIKKDQYFLFDLFDSFAQLSNLYNHEYSYLSVIITYLFLDQANKIPLIFDHLMIKEKKFQFFIDFYLKKQFFKNYTFKGENMFYELSSRLINQQSDSIHLNQDIFIKREESEIGEYFLQNLNILLDNDTIPHMTMFLFYFYDTDTIYKKLLKKRNRSYFLINCFNQKYKIEHLELIQNLLTESSEKKVIALQCLWILSLIHISRNDHESFETSNYIKKLKYLMKTGIEKNINNYTITYQGDIGHICRFESFLILLYQNDDRFNNCIIKFLYDKNSELREKIISLLAEIGIFKNIKSFKKFSFKNNNTIDHLLTDSLFDSVLDNHQISINSELACFLKHVDESVECLLDDYSREKSFFIASFQNYSKLNQKYKKDFAMAIFSYFANCDGSIYQILFDNLDVLVDHIDDIMKVDRRNLFLCLNVMKKLIENNFKNFNSQTINQVKLLEDDLLDNYKNFIIKHLKISEN